MQIARPAFPLDGPEPRARGSARWTWRAGVVLLGVWLLAAGPLAAEAPGYKEHQIKAAFLYNFTKYVEWPADSFADGDAPIVIAVLGRNPVGDELQKAVAGRRVNGRPIVVRTVATAAEARAAHLLFVPEAEEKHFVLLAPELGLAPILTVGESESFSKLGGAIHLVREADKVRFAINLEASEARRLKISAQLLKLAVVLHSKT